MLNTCVLIGYIMEKPVVLKKSNNTRCSLIVASDRPFRESDGSMKKDIFNVIIWRGIAEEISEIARPGMMIAIKGRLRAECMEKHGEKQYMCQVIAENVSFPDRWCAIHETG